MPKPIFVLNGPNLNLLGVREPSIYGAETLTTSSGAREARAQALGLSVDFRQSNQEGELVDWIQEAREKAGGIILNAGAYTHTSVAILDALNAAEKPVIELHLSNVFRRESFRHHSYVSPAAQGVICGFGPKGYELAVEAMADLLAGKRRAAGLQGAAEKESETGLKRMAKDMKGKGSAEQGLIRELAELLEETGLSEIEIEREGMRVRVARQIAVAGDALLQRPSPAPAQAAGRSAPGRGDRQRPASIPASIPAPCHRRWSAPPTWRPSPARRPSSRSARASPRARRS